MESFDFINGWDRFIVFVCLVVMVREVVVMFVVCKEKRWFMLIWLNCCIVVIIKFVVWINLILKCNKVIFICKKGISVIVFDFFILVILDMFLLCFDMN